MSSDLEQAKEYNTLTWQLIEKDGRDSEEDLMMVSYAHTSLAHWLIAGTITHKMRGYWLLSRVYCLIEDAKMALLYANLCNQLCAEHPDKCADFDLAYAAEALARANAMAGANEPAEIAHAKAEMLGNMINNTEDKQLFENDLASGPWFGLKKARYKFCNG